MRVPRTIVASWFVALASCAAPPDPVASLPPMQSDPTGRFVGWLDVPYATQPDVEPELQTLALTATKSQLDLIRRRDEARRAGEPLPAGLPVIVFFHGGSFSAGHKTDLLFQKVPLFCGAGFLLASANYRLSPAAKHPAHVEDAARAIAWLHDNVARFGGDPNRFVLSGHSAGAHLAALLATDERWLGRHGLPLSIVKGVVSLDGATFDLLSRSDDEPFAAAGIVNAFGDDKAVWADASPIRHVAAGKGIPPFLMFSTLQRDFALVETRKFADVLKQAGVAVDVVPVEGQSHTGIHRDFGKVNDRVTQRTLQFVCEVTGVPLPAPPAAAPPADKATDRPAPTPVDTDDDSGAAR
jgi:acetyl esterase/lipase